MTQYNGIATVANGVPAEYASISTTGLTANVASALLYAVPATAAALYRVTAYIALTTPATTSCQLPTIQVSYTDAVSNTVITLDVTPVLLSAGEGESGSLSANVLTLALTGVVALNAKPSTNINYLTTGYTSSGATAMAYALKVLLEGM